MDFQILNHHNFITAIAPSTFYATTSICHQNYVYSTTKCSQ